MSDGETEESFYRCPFVYALLLGYYAQGWQQGAMWQVSKGRCALPSTCEDRKEKVTGRAGRGEDAMAKGKAFREVREDGFVIGNHPFVYDRLWWVSHRNRPDRYLQRNGSWAAMADYFDSRQSAETAIIKAAAPNEQGLFPERTARDAQG